MGAVSLLYLQTSSIQKGVSAMPRRGHHHDEDSSSSSSYHSDHSNNNYRIGYGSTCGIKSLNEYQDKLLADDPARTNEAYTEDGDGSAWAGARATNHRSGHFSSEAYAGIGFNDGNNTWGRSQAGAGAEFGIGGAIAEARADSTVYSCGDNDGTIDVLKVKTGGAKAKVDLGVDLVHMKGKIGENQEVNANLGLNVDTGGEIGVDGVSGSFLGFGASVGRNTGIHTPFGSISFKLW